VQDARSALRYVRAHCKELNIAPDRIIANGASAGGHLALATELFAGLDEPGEDTAVSCRPNALVLFSPVTNTMKAQKRLGERWRELSPLLRLAAKTPPALIFHGTADKLEPFADAKAFHDAMIKAGNRCELVSVADAPHGYMFTSEAHYTDTVRRMSAFLGEIGFPRAGADAKGAAQ